METAYVPLPDNLNEHEEAVWVDGFKAGVNWLHKTMTGSEDAFPMVDEELLSLPVDDDGNPIV